MTGLNNEIRQAQTKRSSRNRIQEILDVLDDEDKAALRAALDDKSVPAVNIARVLRARGLAIAESTISNYRRGLYDAL